MTLIVLLEGNNTVQTAHCATFPCGHWPDLVRRGGAGGMGVHGIKDGNR